MHNNNNLGTELWGGNNGDLNRSADFFVTGVELDVDKVSYSVPIGRV